MLRNKKFLIVLVLILIAILIGVYFYLKSVKQNQIQTGMTDEQRTAIFNDLNNQNIKPITPTERTQILKDLNSESVNTSITEEERTSILNQLNNTQ